MMNVVNSSLDNFNLVYVRENLIPISSVIAIIPVALTAVIYITRKKNPQTNDSKNKLIASDQKVTTIQNKKWILKTRPSGLFQPSDCELIEEDIHINSLPDDYVILQTEYLSIDAFVRTMLDENMNAVHQGAAIGSVIPSLGIGKVIYSGKTSKHKIGSYVSGLIGAQSYPSLSGSSVFGMLPIPAVSRRDYLGLFGFTCGLTAWVGIFATTRKVPKKGDVVVVSACTGGVGSVAAQLALSTGATVIGIAGGKEKCKFLVETMKLHGAIDYKATTTTTAAAVVTTRSNTINDINEKLSSTTTIETVSSIDNTELEQPSKSSSPSPQLLLSSTLAAQLDELAPTGVDFYFDNVGGETLDIILSKLNHNGQIILCGAVSQYSGNLNVGKVQGPSNYLKLAEKDAIMKGYNMMYYLSYVPRAIFSLLWLRYRKKVFMYEQIENGIESYPIAMQKMFTGKAIGKIIVEV